jgi:DNA-binding response OmpR family regulator
MSWKVLLLDYNSRSAGELRPALSEVGCEFDVIVDKRALAAAKSLSDLTSKRFDAVLLSVALPRLAGVGLFDRIHQDTRGRGVPVILVGSDARLLTWHETTRTPAEGYLLKPAGHDALVAELGALLRAVVGAGTRTVPPPSPGAGQDVASAAGASEGADVAGPSEGPIDEGRVGRTRTESRLRVVSIGASSGKRRKSTKTRVPEPVAADVAPTTRHADEQSARIRHLEAALERSLERLREAGRQLEGERTAHHEALSSMAAELHALSVKLGKKLTDATARAGAAEERARAAQATTVSALAAAEEAVAAKHQELLETEAAAILRTQAVDEELRRQRVEHEGVAAESERRRCDLETRLDREIAARREDQQVAVAALRSAEERIAALVAQAPPVASRRSMPAPSSQALPSVPPSSSDLVDRRSSGPPPVKSGPRVSARPMASLEGDRDDTRPPGCRAVLLIDGDKAARVNTARALARASCEVTVRDSCLDVATVIGTFDVIVTEAVGVSIDELLDACRERPHACAIVVWTLAVESARAMFDEAGIQRVSFLQKAYRADDLVTAVQARLDESPNVALG